MAPRAVLFRRSGVANFKTSCGPLGPKARGRASRSSPAEPSERLEEGNQEACPRQGGNESTLSAQSEVESPAPSFDALDAASDCLHLDPTVVICRRITTGEEALCFNVDHAVDDEAPIRARKADDVTTAEGVWADRSQSDRVAAAYERRHAGAGHKDLDGETVSQEILQDRLGAAAETREWWFRQGSRVAGLTGRFGTSISL